MPGAGFNHTMIGSRLAHYDITAHLGSGGFGDVYQATDTKLGRSVAIKLLPEEFNHDAERVARFQREARVLASLNHPNIAAIYGLEESGGRNFLVMEFVPGETLAARIKRGPIPLEDSLVADHRGAGGGARERKSDLPPRSEMRECDDHAGRKGKGPGLRLGEGLRAGPFGRESVQFPDAQRGRNQCRCDSRHSGL